MRRVLVTGASGFVGSKVVQTLKDNGIEVVAVSRNPVDHADYSVVGSFLDEDVLAQVDQYQVDSVIHLAAEIGGCSEEAGLSVNVQGTRRLLRHFVDAGVSNFVLASSIAAAIGLDRNLFPTSLPVGDDYPSIANDAYGLSKALMEQVAFYFQRQNPHLNITLFRIGVVLKEDAAPTSVDQVEKALFPFVSLTTIHIHDVCRAFLKAVTSTPVPGVHRVNLVAPQIRSPHTVVETLRMLYPERFPELSLEHYERPGHENDSLFATERLAKEFGFQADIDPRTMKTADAKDTTP
jgi:UDP-glucose 4-epimerase